MQRKTFLIFLSLSTALVFGLLPQVQAPEDVHFYNPQTDHIVDAGVSFNVTGGSFIIHKVASVKIELYGDIVQTEHWGLNLHAPTSVSVHETSSFWISVDVPGDAYNMEYGFILLYYFEGERVAGGEVFITVENGLPYKESRPIYNHTGYIVADDMLRDLYLPVRGVTVTALDARNDYEPEI